MKQPNIIHVEAADFAWSDKLLDDLISVLQKHRAVLVHKPDCMVLARAGIGDKWDAMAQVLQIAPDGARWRPVQGRKPS